MLAFVHLRCWRIIETVNQISFVMMYPWNLVPGSNHRPVINTLFPFSDLDSTPFVGCVEKNIWPFNDHVSNFCFTLQWYKKKNCHAQSGCSLLLCPFPTVTFEKIIGAKIFSASLKQMSCQPKRAVLEGLCWRIWSYWVHRQHHHNSILTANKTKKDSKTPKST